MNGCTDDNGNFYNKENKMNDNIFNDGTTTYTISLDKLKVIFAARLNVDAKRISIAPITVERGNQRDSYNEFSGLKVTVTGVAP